MSGPKSTRTQYIQIDVEDIWSAMYFRSIYGVLRRYNVFTLYDLDYAMEYCMDFEMTIN